MQILKFKYPTYWNCVASFQDMQLPTSQCKGHLNQTSLFPCLFFSLPLSLPSHALFSLIRESHQFSVPLLFSLIPVSSLKNQKPLLFSHVIFFFIFRHSPSILPLSHIVSRVALCVLGLGVLLSLLVSLTKTISIFKFYWKRMLLCNNIFKTFDPSVCVFSFVTFWLILISR